jgi:hypothetical protein
LFSPGSCAVSFLPSSRLKPVSRDSRFLRQASHSPLGPAPPPQAHFRCDPSSSADVQEIACREVIVLAHSTKIAVVRATSSVTAMLTNSQLENPCQHSLATDWKSGRPVNEP